MESSAWINDTSAGVTRLGWSPPHKEDPLPLLFSVSASLKMQMVFVVVDAQEGRSLSRCYQSQRSDKLRDARDERPRRYGRYARRVCFTTASNVTPVLVMTELIATINRSLATLWVFIKHRG